MTGTTDPVSTNNTSTVLTVVQPLVCATPGKDGAGGTITGVVNTYYAGVGTAAAGTNSLTVTTPSSGSATQIGVGDLLLVIQMQGAQINSTNTTLYGDGVPGPRPILQSCLRRQPTQGLKLRSLLSLDGPTKVGP